MAAPGRTDFWPAITGLVVGGCVLFVLCYGVMKWTNQKFVGHAAAPGAAAPSGH